MNPEIEYLIEMALADGEITEKKRAIILRKAESLCLSLDEVEMIIDGRIALSKKEHDNVQTSLVSKSNKEGNIKKCPSCGSVVKSFSTNCIDCGFEFRGIDNTKYILKLKNELDNLKEIEKKSFDDRLKKANWFERMDVGCNPTIFEANLIDKQINLILQFPFPTTKEDILEFLSMSIPQSNKITSKSLFTPLSLIDQANNRLANAWRNKSEQAIIKARFSMKDDKKTLEIIEEYAKQLKL